MNAKEEEEYDGGAEEDDSKEGLLRGMAVVAGSQQ